MCNVTTSTVQVVYTITATLVTSGVIVYSSSLAVVGNEARTVSLNLEEYVCQSINYSVSLYGQDHTVSTVDILPACMNVPAIFMIMII